jgi:Fur family transcriptional regulator, ferric uptake regulator
MPTELEYDHFVSYLRGRGMRVTTERQALFGEIFRQHRHLDADQLLAAMQERGYKISRATVYRNLDLLVDCGLVQRQRLGRRKHVYEHLHAGQPHDHLICTDCGRVVEFVSRAIASLQREICRAHGFDPDVHSLQIQGLCDRCSSQRSRRQGQETTAEAADQYPSRGAVAAIGQQPVGNSGARQ